MNIEIDKIENLIKVMKEHNLEEIEFKDKEQSIRLKNKHYPQHSNVPFPNLYYQMPQEQSLPTDKSHTLLQKNDEKAQTKPTSSTNKQTILSPFVGTFYGASSPGASTFVSVGSKVKKGDTLCIVEAMKLMNEIESEYDGTIVEILVQEEQPIEYNQALCVIET